MTIISSSVSSSYPKQLRPFEMHRDLDSVADLIESCFSATLDPDGRRYLRKMRAVAKRTGFGRWSKIASGSSFLPITGFVWEEGGEVVGNLSLIPYIFHGRRMNLIANVAVAPDFRRRGIAQALTTAALDHCQRRRVSSTWLQVRHDNQVALDLYLSRGFVPRARRTTWTANPGLTVEKIPDEVQVWRRNKEHWSMHKDLLEQNYPTSLWWHFPLNMNLLKPGFFGWIYRFVNEVDIQHWVIEVEEELGGIISWHASHGYSDTIWIAASPEYDEPVIRTIFPHLHRAGYLRRPISLNYPEDRASGILSDVGFEYKNTLIWMEVKLK